MTKEQEIQLIKKAQQGDIEAENSVALAYLNLAKSIARSFGIAGAYDVDDLAGYGMLGLIRAIHTYDETAKQTSKPMPLGASKTQSWTRCENRNRVRWK